MTRFPALVHCSVADVHVRIQVSQACWLLAVGLWVFREFQLCSEDSTCRIPSMVGEVYLPHPVQSVQTQDLLLSLHDLA